MTNQVLNPNDQSVAVMRQQLQVGAGGIVVHDGRTLLARRRGAHGEGSWGSFGGHVEAGESPQETVIREAYEELGIRIGNLRFLYCLNMIKYGTHYLDVGFVADIVSGEPRAVEADRIERVEWFSLNTLPEPLFEPVRIALDAYQGGDVYREVREQ